MREHTKVQSKVSMAQQQHHDAHSAKNHQEDVELPSGIEQNSARLPPRALEAGGGRGSGAL